MIGARDMGDFAVGSVPSAETVRAAGPHQLPTVPGRTDSSRDTSGTRAETRLVHEPKVTSPLRRLANADDQAKVRVELCTLNGKTRKVGTDEGMASRFHIYFEFQSTIGISESSRG